MLKISWGNHVPLQNISESNGYGFATKNIVTALRKLGYQVTYNDASADVHFHFDQPQWLKKPREDIYTIIYHPWESTQLLEGWADIMNTADEVWTPSPIIADWYQKFAGIEKDVYVYEHGVSSEWSLYRRPKDSKVRFLHVGGEALRKGGKETMRAFKENFSDVKNTELNMKMIQPNWNVKMGERINIIKDHYQIRNLVRLYRVNQIFVYPSYGEGFGMNPLQAMSTGMPTIISAGWAPYERFTHPELLVKTTMVDSPWPDYHPGKVLEPDLDSLGRSMKYAYDNYPEVLEFAIEKTPEIREYYDWTKLTEKAFGDLAHRLEN